MIEIHLKRWNIRTNEQQLFSVEIRVNSKFQLPIPFSSFNNTLKRDTRQKTAIKEKKIGKFIKKKNLFLSSSRHIGLDCFVDLCSTNRASS